MNANQILALAPTDYARIFPEARNIRADYHDLLFAWHPDRQSDPQAAAVTAHLKMLHDEACKARDAGTWAEPNTIRLHGEGRQFIFRFLRKVETPAGDLLVGRQRLAVVAGEGMDDLVRQACKVTAGLPPLPREKRAEFSALLPSTYRPMQSGDRATYTFTADARTVRLRDLLGKSGGLDPKHVAWIMSGAYNLACYLEFAGITHLGLDADHLFIVPETHQVALLTGWEFAALDHGRPMASSPFAASVLGRDLTAKPASPRHHLRLLRALGRDCLGDPSGARLSTRSDIPRPLARWLQLPPGDRAQPEYAAWEQCLIQSFGPRRFQTLSVTHSDIYGN